MYNSVRMHSSARKYLRWIDVAVLGCVFFSLGNGLSAQETTLEGLRLRLDSLRSLHSETARMAQDGDPVQWTSRRIAAFNVTASTEEIDRASGAVARAWEQLDASWTAGFVEKDGSVSDLVFLPARDSRVPETSAGARIFRPSRFRSLEKRAGSGVQESLNARVPDDLSRWMGSQAVTTPVEDRWIRRALLGSGYDVGHRCMEGDGASCLLALGLVDGPWHDVFTDAELLGRQNPSFTRFKEDDLFAPCLRSGDRLTCTRFLDRNQRSGYKGNDGPRAFPPQVRQHFLRYLLQEGGAGSFDRLVASDPELTRVDRLGQVVEGPLSDIAGEWAQSVVVKPDTRFSRPLSADGLTAIGWLFILGLFTTRSTRWRK